MQYPTFFAPPPPLPPPPPPPPVLGAGYFTFKSSVLGSLLVPLPIITGIYLYFLEQKYLGPVDKVCIVFVCGV